MPRLVDEAGGKREDEDAEHDAAGTHSRASFSSAVALRNCVFNLFATQAPEAFEKATRVLHW